MDSDTWFDEFKKILGEASETPKVNSATSYGTLKNFKEIKCQVCHKKLKKNRAKWLYEMAFCSKKHKKVHKKALGMNLESHLPSNIFKEASGYKLFPGEIRRFEETLRLKKKHNEYETKGWNDEL